MVFIHCPTFDGLFETTNEHDTPPGSHQGHQKMFNTYILSRNGIGITAGNAENYLPVMQ